MKCLELAASLSLLLGACAASDDGNTRPAPKVEAEPAPTAAISDAAPLAAKGTPPAASIASVQLNQDCPDAKPELAAEQPRGAARQKRSDSARGLVQPCNQSSVQLAFSAGASGSTPVALNEVRLLSSEGKLLATLSARMPTIWSDNGYLPWDGVLSAGSDQKVSYKLSIPDWVEVEKRLGGPSYGQMFALEVDVTMAGRPSTLRSPEFERARPEIIRT